ncbi:hypothetical protein AB0J77_14610 [Micromonospora tulbaghiae]|uniref:hypothetical protein n=1 Tax=Micromonospora tulbaghiae TaxID=479978 RepID=UPI0034188B99
MTQPEFNTDPPAVRCGMCGGRCKGDILLSYPRWIVCRSGCPWSSHSPRRTGWIWRMRVLIGW